MMILELMIKKNLEKNFIALTKIDLLTDSYVLSRQQHITKKELEDSYKKIKE